MGLITPKFKDGQLSFMIGDGSSVITTGVKYIDLHVPFDCNIIEWVLFGVKESGSIVIDIWAEDTDNYPPTVADTITASDKPTLSAARVAYGTALTGWGVGLLEGDILRINVDSVTTLTQAMLVLSIERTS